MQSIYLSAAARPLGDLTNQIETIKDRIGFFTLCHREMNEMDRFTAKWNWKKETRNCSFKGIQPLPIDVDVLKHLRGIYVKLIYRVH